MNHYLLSTLSDALDNCPGDAQFATEQPPICHCTAHAWPHMAEVSLKCTRRRFADRQWEKRFKEIAA